jgi:hypothetical protein
MLKENRLRLCGKEARGAWYHFSLHFCVKGLWFSRHRDGFGGGPKARLFCCLVSWARSNYALVNKLFCYRNECQLASKARFRI